MEQHPQRPGHALIIRTAGAMAFATMAMMIKLAGESGVSLPEIMFWRQVVTMPLLLGYLGLTGGRSGLSRLKTGRLGAHAMRSAIGMIAMVCNFSAVLLLPLAESTSLSFTSSLFAVIIAALAMREHIGPWRWAAVALGFAGVLIIAQPGQAPIPLIGGAVALTSALLTASVSFLIRDMGRTEEPLRIVFYFALFGSAMMLPALPFTMTAHSAWQWQLLLAIGAAGMAGQLLFTASLRIGEVASVMIMDYTSLIWAALFGWLIWDRLPPATTWLGAPLIIGAGVVIAWREHRLSRDAAPPAAIALN